MGVYFCLFGYFLVFETYCLIFTVIHPVLLHNFPDTLLLLDLFKSRLSAIYISQTNSKFCKQISFHQKHYFKIKETSRFKSHHGCLPNIYPFPFMPTIKPVHIWNFSYFRQSTKGVEAVAIT